MDISKIRKKALAKEAGKKTGEGGTVSGAAEEKTKLPEEVPPAGENAEMSPQEKVSEEEIRETEPVAPEGPEEEDLTGGSTETLVELLTFSLSHEEYAFRVSEVEEILRLQTITSVPTMADYLLGITSLRGKIIPVLDLRRRLNLEGKSSSRDVFDGDHELGTKKMEERKILIIEGPKGLIGATIDKVIGVVRLPLSEILQPPGHLDEDELKFIEGIVVLEKRFISIINSGAAMDIETS